MVRKVCSAGAALVALALFAPVAFPQGDALKPAPTEDSAFAGKLVAVCFKDDHGAWIRNARICQIAGRTFLTGAIAKSPKGIDMPEVVGWFAMDEIKSIIAYKSMADAEKLYDEWDAMRAASQPQTLPEHAP